MVGMSWLFPYERAILPALSVFNSLPGELPKSRLAALPWASVRASKDDMHCECQVSQGSVECGIAASFRAICRLILDIKPLPPYCCIAFDLGIQAGEDENRAATASQSVTQSHILVKYVSRLRLMRRAR